MLSELHVEHLGVIERLDLVLGPGLTAVTGETGAGKTMLVEALELLVGGRADAAIVRPGAPEVRIDGRFVGLGGEGASDDELVLSRVVPAEGRSRAYVDGRPSTVAALSEVAAPIVDLHGQHAHQSLLATATQRAALDQFGGVDLAPLRAARARLTELDAELAALGGDLRARAREIDLLRFQVDELVAAGLDDSDEERRDSRRSRTSWPTPSGIGKPVLSPTPRWPTTEVGATRWPPPSGRWPAGPRTARSRNGLGPCSPSSTT